MGRIFGCIIVLLCCIILPAAAARAKTPKEVYLKDGGIIECQKVWQANGKVVVLVNRDILVDFSRDEIDLQKTFVKKPVKGVKKEKVRKKAAAKPGAIMPQAAAQHPAPPPRDGGRNRPEARAGPDRKTRTAGIAATRSTGRQTCSTGSAATLHASCQTITTGSKTDGAADKTCSTGR